MILRDTNALRTLTDTPTETPVRRLAAASMLRAIDDLVDLCEATTPSARADFLSAWRWINAADGASYIYAFPLLCAVLNIDPPAAREQFRHFAPVAEHMERELRVESEQRIEKDVAKEAAQQELLHIRRRRRGRTKRAA